VELHLLDVARFRVFVSLRGCGDGVLVAMFLRLRVKLADGFR